MNAIKEAIKQIEVGWKSQKIRLVGTKLSQDEFNLLVDTLKVHYTVKSLEICMCELSEESIINFAKDMQSFALVGLQLVHVGISQKGARAIATAIQECPLKKLDLTSNEIGVEGAVALANALRDCGLESLLIGRNQIATLGAKYLASVLKEGGTILKTLDISRNRIGDLGLIAIAEALPHTSLDSLQLENNEITVEGVKKLCAALKLMTKARQAEFQRKLHLQRSTSSICSSESDSAIHLGSLYLGYNHLKDDSAREISDVIRSSSVEKVMLNNNEISDEGAVDLASAIKESNTIMVVDLQHNRQIGAKGINALCEAVKTHRTIRKITLRELSFTSPERDRLEKMLANLHCERARVMTILCAACKMPRLGSKAAITRLGIDLMRSLACFLG